MRAIVKITTNVWFLSISVLILAGLFRLPLMQYVEFKGDEALNLFLASRFLFHHPFPPAAQASSAGILNFPLLNYLLFPIVIFTIYPPTVSLVIAILNVLTIGGFFFLFAKYHGKLTGFLAACSMALSPWAILYSRKIWAQDFLLPLSLPFFLSVYKILEGKKHYWFLFGLTSMALLQIHQLAVLIPLVIFVGLMIKKQKTQWKLLFLGIFIGLIPTIPYFWYMTTSYCGNCQADASLLARFSFHDISSFLRPLQILSIGDFHTEMGNDFALFASQYHILYLASKLTYLAYLLVPIAIIFFWMKNKIYGLFATATVTYTLVLFVFGIESLMHYYILLIPFLSLFIAYLITFVMSKKRIQLLGIFVVVVYFAALIAFDYAFLRLLSQKGGFGGDYGAGFATSEQAANRDLKKFKNAPNYKELELIYFLPREFFHGYMPVGKMIYPLSDLGNGEIAREKQFMHDPTNPLLTMQIFAYYTQNQDPSWEYVVMLKNKAVDHAVFSFVYQQVLNEYLSAHLKNIYETPDFLLLYPQHWHATTIQDGVSLSDGAISVTVIKLLSPGLFTPDIAQSQTKNVTLAGKSTNQITCMTKDNLWCGTLDNPVLLRANYYAFESKPVAITKTNNVILRAYSAQVFNEITQSAAPLN